MPALLSPISRYFSKRLTRTRKISCDTSATVTESSWWLLVSWRLTWHQDISKDGRPKWPSIMKKHSSNSCIALPVELTSYPGNIFSLNCGTGFIGHQVAPYRWPALIIRQRNPVSTRETQNARRFPLHQYLSYNLYPSVKPAWFLYRLWWWFQIISRTRESMLVLGS